MLEALKANSEERELMLYSDAKASLYSLDNPFDGNGKLQCKNNISRENWLPLESNQGRDLETISKYTKAQVRNKRYIVEMSEVH